MDARARRRVDLSSKRWNAAIARRVLDEFAASGMSLTTYARSLGVNLQRLSWWRKRLAEDTGGQAVTFVPAAVGRAQAGTIVRLPRGVEIEVTDVTAVPVRWVAELARELAGMP
jgi:hypothetical protein